MHEFGVISIRTTDVVIDSFICRRQKKSEELQIGGMKGQRKDKI